ncbi:cupin domain-containing protein [Polaromonas sp. YR568]|uniref:JmjC domain-containing protein n=1 Tax=Polaromonas sp. YR568 TaxID=1855301 RepID=UPI003137A38A
MDVHQPLPLLAGLSPAQFMRRHWQKKPLLVRQAIPGFQPLLSRTALFRLAAQASVESRLIVHEARKWRMTQGPLPAKSLPPLNQKAWTLLVQGVDLHDASAHALLQNFRFVPDARMDDLMISFATPGGGVGPHFDSYDVFLLQASGRRRWQIGRQQDLSLQSGVPLKILKHFEPEEEFVLEAGDMLYLPPRYAHDGVALAGAKGQADDCMTYSIGFRAPAKHELAAELLHRLAEFSEEAGGDLASGQSPPEPALYRDKTQVATDTPAALPSGLVEFAGQAVLQALKDPLAVACALGEYMTEPKPSVWFDEPQGEWDAEAVRSGRSQVRLDARTRMMYDAAHVFINGDSYRAKGADATLMRQLADGRGLDGARLRAASPAALGLLAEWHDAGWLHQLS